MTSSSRLPREPEARLTQVDPSTEKPHAPRPAAVRLRRLPPQGGTAEILLKISPTDPATDSVTDPTTDPATVFINRFRDSFPPVSPDGRHARTTFPAANGALRARDA